MFAREGFRGASLEQVADEAGFSKGAVYSNFESKEEVFLALLEREEQGRQDDLVRLLAGVVGTEAKVAAAGHWAGGTIDEQAQWCLLFTEFWSYAVRDERLRPRLAALYDQWRDTVSVLVQSEAERLGLLLPVPAGELAATIIAMCDGFALQRLAEPSRFGPESLANMFSVLFAGVLAMSSSDAPDAARERPAVRSTPRKRN